MPLSLANDGAQIFPAALSETDLKAIESALASTDARRPGTRLSRNPALAHLLNPSVALGQLAADLLGPLASPLRAVLFNKSPAANWSLGWHQDRTIAVAERIEAPGFADWTLKSGIHHVIPPFELLERSLTLRIHLDPVTMANAPLQIAPGSHRLGRIPEPEIPAIVTRLGAAACLAERGDIWVYAAPILHASDRAIEPKARRVLQILYSADTLPNGLRWFGV